MPIRTLNFMIRWSMVAWLSAAFLLVPWVIDRQPPFSTLGASYLPPIYPGSPMRLVLEVRRDKSRSCAVTGSRWVQDRDGARFYLESLDLSADAVSDLETSTPDQAIILFDVHRSAVKGPASYHADLQYVCNPLHHVWPIRVESLARFLIE